jgi:DNA-binding GntR family transcriptional regulator
MTTSNFLSIDDIYNVLRKEILSLVIEPGSLLSENMISSRFGISRTPIRSVIERLSMDGLIDVVPKKGSYVRLIDLELSEQIIYMRIQTEIAVMSKMAKRPIPELMKLLEYNLHEQKKILSTGVIVEDFYRLDSQFHELCMQYAGKRKLWQMIQQMDVHYSRYRRMDYKLSEKQNVYEYLYQQHFELYQAMLSKEPEKLKYLITLHLYSGIIRMDTRVVSEYNHYFVEGNRTIHDILLEVKMEVNEAQQEYLSLERKNKE